MARAAARWVRFSWNPTAMGLLTFGLNVTLDGCIDHTQGIVDDELHDYWTQLMDQSGAMLFGRNTYELMEGAWPAVARDEKAPRAMREWAQKLEAKAKYVVSGSRSDFPWQNTIKVEGDLREAISALKAKTERGVLVGAPKLAAALEELGLIDEYRIVVHPIISGRGPTLLHGLSSARHLELLSKQRLKSGVQSLNCCRKSGGTCKVQYASPAAACAAASAASRRDGRTAYACATASTAESITALSFMPLRSSRRMP